MNPIINKRLESFHFINGWSLFDMAHKICSERTPAELKVLFPAMPDSDPDIGLHVLPETWVAEELAECDAEDLILTLDYLGLDVTMVFPSLLIEMVVPEQLAINCTTAHRVS